MKTVLVKWKILKHAIYCAFKTIFIGFDNEAKRQIVHEIQILCNRLNYFE